MDSPHLLPHSAPQGAQEPGAEDCPGLEYTLTLAARPARGALQPAASGRLLPGVGSRRPRDGTGVRVLAGDPAGLTLTLD